MMTGTSSGSEVRVPDARGVDHDAGAVAALVQATAVVDADFASQAGFSNARLEGLMNSQPIAVNHRAIIAAGADEDVLLERNFQDSVTPRPR